jgi:hypothetical protein
VIFAIDAFLKCRPGFAGSFLGQVGAAARGSAGLAAAVVPFLGAPDRPGPVPFAYLSAILESLFGLGLLFGLARQVTYFAAAAYAFFLWAIPKGLGGPYTRHQERPSGRRELDGRAPGVARLSLRDRGRLRGTGRGRGSPSARRGLRPSPACWPENDRGGRAGHWTPHSRAGQGTRRCNRLLPVMRLQCTTWCAYAGDRAPAEPRGPSRHSGLVGVPHRHRRSRAESHRTCDHAYIPDRPVLWCLGRCPCVPIRDGPAHRARSGWLRSPSPATSQPRRSIR